MEFFLLPSSEGSSSSHVPVHSHDVQQDKESQLAIARRVTTGNGQPVTLREWHPPTQQFHGVERPNARSPLRVNSDDKTAVVAAEDLSKEDRMVMRRKKKRVDFSCI